MQLGENIKRIRLTRELTQKALAMIMFGKPERVSYISDVERGKLGVGNKRLVEFTQALSCTANDLLFAVNSTLEPEAQADLETAKVEHQILTDMYLEDAPKTMAEAPLGRRGA
jgi:transcriptional regulator with XRE-family HTH domain